MRPPNLRFGPQRTNADQMAGRGHGNVLFFGPIFTHPAADYTDLSRFVERLHYGIGFATKPPTTPPRSEAHPQRLPRRHTLHLTACRPRAHQLHHHVQICARVTWARPLARFSGLLASGLCPRAAFTQPVLPAGGHRYTTGWPALARHSEVHQGPHSGASAPTPAISREPSKSRAFLNKPRHHQQHVAARPFNRTPHGAAGVL